MLTILFSFLRLVLIPSLYIGGIVLMLITIFKRMELGLFFLLFLVSQPNVWFKLHDYPMGNYYITFIFLAVCIGIIVQGKGFKINSNSVLIFVFMLVSFFALCNSSLRFSLSSPLSGDNPFFKPWKNYAMMMGTYILTLNSIRTEKHRRVAVLTMVMVILIISVRSYRGFTAGPSFVAESRYAGPFWIVGLGSNHLGAFIAEYGAIVLGLLVLGKESKAKRLIYLATVLLCIHPLFFSYSRGAYLAAFAVLVFFGLAKKRSLLILVFVLVIAGQTVLPSSVVERIMMTKSEGGQLEYSAEVRLELWNMSIDLFNKNPIFGIGFGGFGLSVREEIRYNDTHNFYLKMLCEQGIIGFALLLLVLYRAICSGIKLIMMSNSPFNKGLGFGFLGCILAMTITNMFGDRWSYLELGSFFWALWGIVDRGIIISKQTSDGNLEG